MKNLCLDARMVFSGGIGTYIKNLALHLKNANFRLSLLCDPAKAEAIPWMKGFEIISCRSSIYSLREQFELPLCIPRCDLFWSPHFNVPIFPIKAKKRLVTICDAFHLAFFSTLSPIQKAYAKIFLKAAGALSEEVITISNFSKLELTHLAKINERKLHVIHLGVDHDLFHAQKDPLLLKKVKELYNLPANFILFVGNIKPHKNVKGLLKAFSLLVKKENIDSDLVIIGQRAGFTTGENLDDVLQNDISKRVFFLDYIEEYHLTPIYQLAQMMVLPSFYEGFGLPALESMSCGCPVVVSKVASLPEVCGDAVKYIDPFDPQDIANGILKILQDRNLRDLLVQKGLQHAQSFRWEETTRKHLKLIETIL